MVGAEENISQEASQNLDRMSNLSARKKFKIHSPGSLDSISFCVFLLLLLPSSVK